MRVAASSTERSVSAAFCCAALVACAAAVPALAQDAAFNAHRDQWKSAALSSYEYGYRKFCECHPDTPPETLVTVRDGAVVGVRHRPVDYAEEVPAEQRNLEFYWTVDGLFDLLASAFDRGVRVRASYDETLGYPTEIYIDYDTEFIGDELDLKLTQVKAL